MLRVDAITVVFGGVTALCDVSFAVKKGDVLGLIGPNGARKTTLMRVITGTVTLVHGTVRLENMSLHRKTPHERIRSGIGMSQQIVHPFRSITALQQEGVTILLVGQNTTRALEVANRICVLESGCDVWRGTAEEAGKDPALIKSYLGLNQW